MESGNDFLSNGSVRISQLEGTTGMIFFALKRSPLCRSVVRFYWKAQCSLRLSDVNGLIKKRGI